MRSDSSQLELNGSKGRLTCGGPSVADGLGCGAVSEWIDVSSPAAPALSIAEKLEPTGWSYDIGFSAMLLGLSVLCPKCTKAARQRTKTERRS